MPANSGDPTSTMYTSIELFAGICSFHLATLAAKNQVRMLPPCGIGEAANKYTRAFFGVASQGDVRKATTTAADFATVSFDCSPYTASGLQRFRNDPKHEQAFWAAHRLNAINPVVAAMEQVPPFYEQDADHGIFTEFSSLLTNTIVHQPVYLTDTGMGGILNRRRGIVFMESRSVQRALPPWAVTAPAPLASGSMMPYLLPTSDVPRSCIRHGHFELSKGKLPNERSASPLVIGWLHWGGPDTPLQAGIIVPL